MTKWYGNIDEDATIKIPFNTVNSSGASVTITDLVASDVYVYKDGTVQTTKGAGVTVSIDHNSTTGSHLITIDTSNTTDAGFYTTGSDYQVELVGVTVDSQTINAWIGSFSIENRFDDVNVVTVAGTTQTANDNGADINAILADTNELQTDWTDGGRLDTILDSIEVEAGTNLPTQIGTAQADLDIITGADGVTLATAQGNYAPNTVVPDAAGTAPTAAEIVTAIMADTSWNAGTIALSDGIKIIAAAVAGDATLSGSTITYADIGDGGPTVFTSTVAASGTIRNVTIS